MTSRSRHSLLPFLGFKPFRDVLKFSGRSTRTEVIHYLVTGLLAHALIMEGIGWFWPTDVLVSLGGVNFAVGTPVTLLVGSPLIALTVRRMHDYNQPGWPGLVPMLLVTASQWMRTAMPSKFTSEPWGLATLIGLTIIGCWLTALFWNETPGPNRFGPDPRIASDPAVERQPA